MRIARYWDAGANEAKYGVVEGDIVRELAGRRHLDLLYLLQRTLREGRKPPQRLDLEVEQVNPHGTLLRGGEEVQQAAAHGELAALFHLLARSSRPTMCARSQERSCWRHASQPRSLRAARTITVTSKR